MNYLRPTKQNKKQNTSIDPSGIPCGFPIPPPSQPPRSNYRVSRVDHQLKSITKTMTTTTTTLSTRANTFAMPAASYFEKSLGAILDPYTKIKNPRGGICMSIAENRLCSEMLIERIKSFNDYSFDALNYTSPNGMPRVRDTVAKFLSARIFGGAVVSSDNLVIGAGVTSLLSELR